MQSLVSFWLLGYTHSMLVYAFDMAFANLDAWSRETPAPKAPRIAIKNGAIDRDEFGNGKGGVRDAYVEVPTASYFTTPGPGTCRELGDDVGYDWTEARNPVRQLFELRHEAERVAGSLVKDHWLTESDAKKIRVAGVTPKR